MYPKMKDKYKNILAIIYLIFYFSFTIESYNYAKDDFYNKYSGAKITAKWINKNLSEDIVLFDKSVFCQSLVPYLKDDFILYDIYYEKNFNELKIYNDYNNDKDFNLKQYSGKYIIVSYGIDTRKNKDILSLVYDSKNSITGEDFKVYKIK